MNKYKEAMNYLWKSYDENKIYGMVNVYGKIHGLNMMMAMHLIVITS